MRIWLLHFWFELPSSLTRMRSLPKELHGYFLILQRLDRIVHNLTWLRLEGKVHSNSTLFGRMGWKESGTNVWSCDTWKTSWTLEREGGNANWYASSPTRPMIWYGPTYLGLNFLILKGPFNFNIGMTFKNTWSPS